MVIRRRRITIRHCRIAIRRARIMANRWRPPFRFPCRFSPAERNIMPNRSNDIPRPDIDAPNRQTLGIARGSAARQSSPSGTFPATRRKSPTVVGECPATRRKSPAIIGARLVSNSLAPWGAQPCSPSRAEVLGGTSACFDASRGLAKRMWSR
jgi:hypothetical protein